MNHGQDLQVTFRALGVDVVCELVCGLDTRTWNYSERLGVGQGPRMTLFLLQCGISGADGLSAGVLPAGPLGLR